MMEEGLLRTHSFITATRILAKPAFQKLIETCDNLSAHVRTITVCLFLKQKSTWESAQLVKFLSGKEEDLN